MSRVIDYISDDLTSYYGLRSPVTVTLGGPGVAGIVTDLVTTADGSLTVEPVGEDRVTLVAHPFPASSHLWNGPNAVPNDRYCSMLASLYHDLIWEHSDELGAAWGATALQVRQWGNGVLRAIWLGASAGPLDRLVGRAAWHICRWTAPIWPTIKRLLRISCAAGLLLLAGCAAPPEWEVIDLDGEEAVKELLDKVAPDVPPPPPERPAPPPPSGADEVAPELLAWDYGGFRGGSAQPVPGCVIADLRVDGRGLSYRWISGGCELLGASSRDDADCIAAAFVRRGGSWRGGKFEWISTDRTFRSWHNVQTGYNGWPTAAIETADAYAFVIVSRDGRRRSNIITTPR